LPEDFLADCVTLLDQRNGLFYRLFFLVRGHSYKKITKRLAIQSAFVKTQNVDFVSTVCFRS